jgi:hypothetical protein
MLNFNELKYTLDSLNKNYKKDVISFAENIHQRTTINNLNGYLKSKNDSINKVPYSEKNGDLLGYYSGFEKTKIIDAAKGNIVSINFSVEGSKTDLEFKQKNINSHWLAIYDKFVIAYACFLMFFIGAPLGAIIRKGGLGLPIVFAILIFMFFKNKKKSSNTNRKKSSKSFLIPALILVFVSVWLANEVTDGQLLLRYQGETAGTLSGSKEKDLNSVTSNRSSIFEGDWELFQENPFGVGAGASQYLRKTLNGVVAHTELSRLIAEHGYLGLIFFSVITILPLLYFKKSYSGELKNFMIALYFLAWYTSFHAATRNFVTPLLIGIAFMHIQPDKSRTEHKKIAA